MPYFATSQEWLRQSALLLEARPTTTRITTKYTIVKPKTRKSKSTDNTTKTPPTTTTTKPPRGDLTIKTYDPVSGTTLKYRTTKAAEVGRLVLCLGRLGTRMTGLKGDPADVEIVAPAAAAAAVGGAGGEDVVMADERASTPVPPAAAAAETSKAAAGGGGGGGGGKGKKKKGKK